jgi:hypothetical protein
MKNSTSMEQIRYLTLLLGVIQVTFGCFVGFIPPTAVLWFRGIVMAHIEFTANGVLLVVLGLIVREMQLGRKTFWIWFYALQIATWFNGASGLMAAFSGQSSKLLTTINTAFPPPNGMDNNAVSAVLMICGIAVLIGLILTIFGLVKKHKDKANTDLSL